MIDGKQMLDRTGLIAFNAVQRAMEKRSVMDAERLGERLGNVLRALDSKHRNRSMSNLKMAFPDWSDRQILWTSKEMYRHFGRITADFLRMKQMSPQEVLDSTEVVGMPGFIEEEQRGKGIIALTGHFGNWERMGALVHASGKKLTVVSRDANQSGVTARMNDIRTSAGYSVLSRGNAAREIFRTLARNEFVGILADQNASEHFVPFFGQPAGTVLGPGAIYEKTLAPTMFFCGVRVGVGKYVLTIGSPIIPEPGQPIREGLMAKFHQELEAKIREYPEQYLWMHDRWKSARQKGLLSV